MNHHHGGQNIQNLYNRQASSPRELGYQNLNPNYHFQNQQLSQQQGDHEGNQNPYLQQHHQQGQQTQQYQIENTGGHNKYSNTYGMQQPTMSQMTTMPLYQNNPNMMNSGLQSNLSMLNPNESSIHNPMINQNLNTQSTLNQSHSHQMSNVGMTNQSSHNQNPNINSSLNPHNEGLHQNIRNLTPNQFMYFNQQSNQQSNPNTSSNVNSYSNMMNQIPESRYNQGQHSHQQGNNVSGGGGGFSPKSLSPDDIVLFKVNPNATNSIYVDGIPIDATEREVAHVFRPFPGFQEVRLIKKEAKSGRQFYFCFVDFENSHQSTIALTTLQGYRFDKTDSKGLKISYAFHAPETIKKNTQPQNTKKFKSKKK